jgi:hypothetical protein
MSIKLVDLLNETTSIRSFSVTIVIPDGILLLLIVFKSLQSF